MASNKKKLNGKRRLRSREWFDAPGDPTMAALYHRSVTGQGQHLDVSAHESAALTTEMHIPNWIYTHQVVQRQTGRHAGTRPTPLTQLPTADGRYVNGGAGQLQANRWKPFVEWMAEKGMAEDFADPKYLEPAVFQENQQRIADKVKEFVGTLTADEAMTGAQERALEAIARDLDRTQPMQRLLEGDVGSGKSRSTGWSHCSALCRKLAASGSS